MNKKSLFIGILSIALFTTLASCNSKEKTESENIYETETTYEDSSNSEEESTYESESTSTEYNSKVSSAEIDDMLDSYEDYVDQYVSYMKKLSKNDMSAMADAPALMEKAEEWGNKMENTKDEMTARQMARMTTISNKMTIAMSDMMDEQKK